MLRDYNIYNNVFGSNYENWATRDQPADSLNGTKNEKYNLTANKSNKGIHYNMMSTI